MDKLIFTFKDCNNEFKSTTVTFDEIAEQMEDFAFEKLCNCNCEPIGESNNIECNCEENAEDFTLANIYYDNIDG